MTKKRRSVWGHIWRIVLCVILFPFFLLIVTGLLLCIPGMQRLATGAAQDLLRNRLGIEASVGSVSVKPLINLKIEDVLATDDSGDTLLWAGELVLRADLHMLRDSVLNISEFRFKDIKADSKDLIGAAAIKGSLDEILLVSDTTALVSGSTLVNKLLVSGLDLDISLRESREKDEDESSPFNWIFDVREASLRDIHVALEPMDIDVDVDRCNLAAMVGLDLTDSYHADSLDLEGLKVRVGGTVFDIDDAHLRAAMDSTFINVHEISARSGPAKVQGKATMDLATMLVDADIKAAYNRSSLHVKGTYCVSDNAYDALAEIDNFVVSDIVQLESVCMADGRINAQGKGFNPMDASTEMRIGAAIDSVRYGGIGVSATSLTARASNGHITGKVNTGGVSLEDSTMTALLRGTVAFSGSSLSSSLPALSVDALLDTLYYANDSLEAGATGIDLKASTKRSATSVALKTDGIALDASAPMHALTLLDRMKELAQDASIDTSLPDLGLNGLMQDIPDLNVHLNASGDNPLKKILADNGLAFKTAEIDAYSSEESGLNASASISGVIKDTLRLDSAAISLEQETDRIRYAISAGIPAQHGLPVIRADADGFLSGTDSEIRLKADADIRDSILNFTGISSLVAADISARLDSTGISATGDVTLGDLTYEGNKFGDRDIHLKVLPLGDNRYDIYADTDDIPASLAQSFIDGDDITLGGYVRASLNARGPLDSLRISGSVTPQQLAINYLPYDVALRLSDVPITLDDMDVTVSDLKVYACDSTFAVIDGVCDLDSMKLDFGIRSSRFIPSPLEKKDSIPFYGNLAAALDAKVYGTLQNLKASGRVDILPETDVTYMIDKKNYVKANADGSMKFDYAPGSDVLLWGKVNVNEGRVVYSPPVYPLQPFDIKKGSCVTLDGPLSSLNLDITATQPAKAIVRTGGERTREVDFIVGLKVKNGLEDLGLDFTLEAPSDRKIQKEISHFTQEECSRIAAALLTTGMYISDDNVAMSESGYALTSLLQRSVNTLAKNKLGNFVDIDLGVGKTEGTTQYTTNYTMAVSKKFFDDRLKVTVGGRYSDNSKSGSDTKSTAGLDNVSAEFLLRKGGKTSLELFHKHDFESIMDGELTKDGLGVNSSFEWYGKDSDLDPFRVDLQGNVSYRSNSQIGPQLSATFSKDNIFHRGETFTTKLQGAYYWKVGPERENLLSSGDTHQIGADFTLSFPEFLRLGKSRGKGETSVSTDFSLGFMHEKIPGSMTRKKLSADISYRFQTGRKVTHLFTPFSLSLIDTEATDEYILKIYEQNGSSMITHLAEDEYIPSIRYKFIYSDLFDKDRTVGTQLELTLKEAGNVISAVQGLFGKDMNEVGKNFIFGKYSQFLKYNLELRNHFRLSDNVTLATRLLSGMNYYYGNSDSSPLSEYFYTGGPNSIRAFAARSIGPGEYYDDEYNVPMVHGGDIRGEANLELRFPLFWMLEGAVFVDAGNVWMLKNYKDYFTEETLKLAWEYFGIKIDYDDGLIWNKLWQQTALGTGFGLRLVFQNIVVRLDTGIAIHAPYNTGVDGYYNIPNFFKDGIRLNFGVGYPF